MRSLATLLFFVLAALAPATAFAGELTFGVVEDADGVTVQVRGFDGDVPKKVITSRTGMLFFFDASKAKTTRLRPAAKHRFAYAQVGQTGNRVALRFAQRERARGNLGAFLTATPVDGGVDIRVTDRAPGEAAPEPANAEATAGAQVDPSAEERGTALAALEASLGGEAAKAAKAPAPAAVDETFEENEGESDEALGAAAPAVGALDPEPDPFAPTEPNASSGSSTGLRSVLAVALMFAFGGAALWWIKRRKRDAATPVLDVVSRVGIGPKQSVVLINAGGRQLLIAATERRIEVLTELGTTAAVPTAELRVPSFLERTREPLATTRAPIPVPSDPSAPAKVAAFKARLEQALGRELTGEHAFVTGASSLTSAEHPLLGDKDSTPPHLRLLSNDPRWTGEGVA